MWLVYLLHCDNGSLYTGITNNLDKRYALHLAGKGARYTRMHRPVGIALTIEFDTKSLALQAEHAIKKMSASQKRQFVLEHQ
jgi:putative endonuclease